MGNTRHALGHSEEAIACYEKALEINPEYAEVHYNYGISLQSLSRSQEAIEHYQEAVRIKPDFAKAHYACGVALQALGRQQQAVEEFQHVQRLKPDNFEAYYKCGVSLQALGRSREAVEHFEKALRINPDDGGVHYGLAWMLATSKEDEIRDGRRAIDHAKRAVELMEMTIPLCSMRWQRRSRRQVNLKQQKGGKRKQSSTPVKTLRTP